jgi:hypothetical protein
VRQPGFIRRISGLAVIAASLSLAGCAVWSSHRRANAPPEPAPESAVPTPSANTPPQPEWMLSSSKSMEPVAPGDFEFQKAVLERALEKQRRETAAPAPPP